MTVTVTHPFSPDRGKAFTLVERRNYWGDDRLIMLDEQGKRRRMKASWTDYEPPTPFLEISNGRAVISDEKALELASLLSRLKENDN